MSILRDVNDLGLGYGHFLITGNDFPDDWGDPTPEEEYIKQRNEEDSLGNLDTKKGWFERRRFIELRENPIGFLENGNSIYHRDQTFTLARGNKWILDSIEEELNKFIKQVEVEGLSTESKLDKEHELLIQRVLSIMNISYTTFKECVPFHDEPIAIESDIPF